MSVSHGHFWTLGERHLAEQIAKQEFEAQVRVLRGQVKDAVGVITRAAEGAPVSARELTEVLGVLSRMRALLSDVAPMEGRTGPQPGY